MSDRTITWKLDVDDASAASKFHQNAEAAKKAAAQQLEQAKASIAASEDRLRFLEKELQDAKRFYAEQKRIAKEAIEDKRQLLALEEKYAEAVFIAQAHLRSQGTKTAKNNFITAQNRLVEHRSLMGSAIPELDAAPESVKAAAEEVENLKEQIVEQKMALRDATAESKKYEAAAKKIAEAQDKASNATEAGRSIIYGFYQAQNALSRAMRGDFSGAMLSAARATSSVKSGMKDLVGLLNKNPWMLFAAAAVAATAIIIRELNRANELKKEFLKSANAQWHANITIGDARDSRENPYSKKLEGMAESHLMTELEYQKRAYENRKGKTNLIKGSLGRATSEEERSKLQAELDEMLALEDEDFKRIQQVEAEIERKKTERERKLQKGVDRRQKAQDERNRLDSERQEGWRRGKRDRRDLEREEELLGIGDPIARLEKQREFLWHDRRVAAQSEEPDAESKLVAVEREILLINKAIGEEKEKQERQNAEALRTWQEQEKALKGIRDQASLVGLGREEWLKKRIEQVRERFKEEEDPVEKAQLGLEGKQLTHELKTLMGVDSGASKEKADTRPLSPTGSGVRMNDMSKVSAGGVKMVEQPFNTNRGGRWQQTAIVGSSSLNELMDLGRKQSPLSVDPQAKIAQNTEKTNELLQDIRMNLKGVK